MSFLNDARAWLAQDPDPETRAELETLMAAGDSAALEARFGSRLAFGTAGLRGELGAGPNRMNRVLVAQAAAGFAAWLLEHGREHSHGDQSVVIGYDARKNSKVFATDTAELMAGAGIAVTLLPRALPTPVLAFAVRFLDASAGVMVTASHNPGSDNGYKVYLGGLDHGAQIVTPVDEQIQDAILAVGPIDSLPRSQQYDIASENVVDEYIARTAAVRTTEGPSPRFVYTPMHGVGWETARAVFAAAGFDEPDVVPEQAEPNPDFPTVRFPNPEEDGALDLAIALATSTNAALVVANDPDADRLAIAVPTASGWRRLSGNEVGALLGWRAAERLFAEDAAGTGHPNHRTLATSVVSSPALKEVARKYNLDYAETLTGFKWIARVGGLGFGFEEALGYLVDAEKVRDKDGISAAVDFLALMAELAQAGTTLDEHQAAFDEKFGAHASSQISIRMPNLAAIAARIAELRIVPPARLGTGVVDMIEDFAGGFGLYPPADILRMWIGRNARVIVRPSGTEPKLKVYIDAWSRNGSLAERRAEAAALVAELDAGARALFD